MNEDYDKFRKSVGVSPTALYQYQAMTNKFAGDIITSNHVVAPTMGGYISPTIIEERQMNVASMDVFSRLMMDRVIFLGTGIDDQVANIITSQLLYLHKVDNEKPIDIYVNSPGGGVYAGYSIIDTMDFITPDVNTVVTGMAASMGFIISISGKHRSALRHSRLMQHQPMGGAQGQASDIEITAHQIGLLKNELYEIISKKTGQPYDKVLADCDRDYWMTSNEALEYGAIDTIIGV